MFIASCSCPPCGSGEASKFLSSRQLVFPPLSLAPLSLEPLPFLKPELIQLVARFSPSPLFSSQRIMVSRRIHCGGFDLEGTWAFKSQCVVYETHCLCQIPRCDFIVRQNTKCWTWNAVPTTSSTTSTTTTTSGTSTTPSTTPPTPTPAPVSVAAAVGVTCAVFVALIGATLVFRALNRRYDLGQGLRRLLRPRHWPVYNEINGEGGGGGGGEGAGEGGEGGPGGQGGGAVEFDDGGGDDDDDDEVELPPIHAAPLPSGPMPDPIIRRSTGARPKQPTSLYNPTFAYAPVPRRSAAAAAEFEDVRLSPPYQAYFHHHHNPNPNPASPGYGSVPDRLDRDEATLSDDIGNGWRQRLLAWKQEFLKGSAASKAEPF